MSKRFNVALSDELIEAIDLIAEKTETSKSDILRKSLQLYLTAKECNEGTCMDWLIPGQKC
ncbi:MAG: ribbon-helix-helix domain-containing protein [Methylococcales bacterium]